MNGRRARALFIPLAAALAAGGAVAGWLVLSEVGDVARRVPVPGEEVDLAPTASGGARAGVTVPGPGRPSSYPGVWPQFLGEARENAARPERPLSPAWDRTPPKVLWKAAMGEGHAGAAVRRGRVFVVDYDQARQEDAVRCLSLDDGAEIWRFSYPEKIKRNHGMSRTVPAVTDRYVVAIGPLGRVHCLDMETGSPVWGMDLVGDFGASVPPWYTGQCPLIDGDRVILAPGGTPLMMAVDLATGRIVWRTPNPGGWGMTHSSIVAVGAGGERQYVYCATRGVVGVSAADGRLLWKKPDWKIAMANVPTPLDIGDGRVLLTGGYNAGAAMVRIRSDGPPEELFRTPPSVFGSDQQTPILSGDRVYGVVPGGELACLDLDGSRRWSSGTVRFGLGPILRAGAFILALADQTGTLAMVDASPDGYRERGRVKVLDGHDAWGPMALAEHRLLLRDLTTMVCLELP